MLNHVPMIRLLMQNEAKESKKCKHYLNFGLNL
jgi:hypothetical protein